LAPLQAPRRTRSVGAKQARLLANAITLEESGPPRVFFWALVLVCVLIVAAVLWAAVTPFSEKVSAPGEIVPAGSVHVVQHLEGGIVAEILVRNGEAVVRGQPVMRLEPAASAAEFKQFRARRAALSQRAADFSAFEAAYPKLAADQRYILATAN